MHASTKYLSLLTLACLVVLAFYSTPTMACTCIPNHPQESFCSADYVIRAYVVNKSLDSDPNYTTYYIQIVETHRITPQGYETLRNGRLLTPHQNSTCAVNLTLGKLYVIAGKGNLLNLCSYIIEYNTRGTNKRKRSLSVNRMQCECKVKICSDNSCDVHAESTTACNWSPFAKCANELQICEKTSGECRWRSTPYYENCILRS